MPMKRIYLISVILLLLLLLLALSFRSSFTKSPTPEPTVTTFPASDGVSKNPIQESADQVLLQSRDGTPFPVRNFLNDADTYELSDDGIYIIGERSEAVVGQQYRIFYDTRDNSIIVSLRSEPLSISRDLAEAELRASTGLSATQLCNALIVVNVPREVSPTYAGRDLGLSFCQGSSRLE